MRKLNNRQRYNSKYGYDVNAIHTLDDIATTSDLNRHLLANIFVRAANDYKHADGLDKRVITAKQFAWSAVYKFAYLNGSQKTK